MGIITPYSAVNLVTEARVDPTKWSRIPSEDTIAKTAGEIEKRGVSVIRVKKREEALNRLVGLIPAGAEVMNGSSTTLIEIGYEDLLQSGKSRWIDLHLVVTGENDDQKRDVLRRRVLTADYFLSGVNAIAETGELMSCDKTGSRVGAWPYAASHLVLVAGVNKIVPTLADAFQRIREYALPLEDARAKRVYGIGSRIGKCAIIANEEIPGRITLILVDESLGY